MHLQQILASLTPVSISAVFVAIVLAATRLAPFTKPYWTWMPKVVQAWLPSVVAGLPVALNAFGSVKTWLDFAQALLVVGAVPLALAVPGTSSPHNHPELDKPKAPGIPPFTACLCIGLIAFLPGCGLFAAAAPYVAQAAIVISDAINAIDAAEALLPSLHLTSEEQASVEKLISRLRAAASAAAKADAGASDLTAEQLDASLADFRAAWADLQGVFAAHRKVGAGPGAEGLPVPLALRRVSK